MTTSAQTKWTDLLVAALLLLPPSACRDGGRGARVKGPPARHDAAAVEPAPPDAPAAPEVPAVSAPDARADTAHAPSDDPDGGPDVAPARDARLADCQLRAIAPERGLQKRPAISWRTPLGWLNVRSGVAVGRSSVAVTTGARLTVVDLTGTIKSVYSAPSFAPLSAPVADEAGNFYVAGAAAVSLSPDGAERWTVGLRSDDPHHGQHPRPLVLGPEAVVFSLQPDGALKALDSSNGVLAWESPAAAELKGATLQGGFADALIVTGVAGRTTRLHDRKTGAVVASFTPPGTLLGGASRFVAGFGLIGGQQRSVGPGNELVVFDEALRPLWRGGVGLYSYPLFVDLQGRLVTLEMDDAARTGPFRRYGCEGGAAEAGVLSSGDPRSRIVASAALGADGQAYLLEASTEGPPFVELVAFDAGLIESWRIRLPGRRLPSSGVLGLPISESGLLIVALEDEAGKGELVAIQTESPGLARTAFATLRGDPGGSSWAPAR
jgi:hypothetical protein